MYILTINSYQRKVHTDEKCKCWILWERCNYCSDHRNPEGSPQTYSRSHGNKGWATNRWMRPFTSANSTKLSTRFLAKESEVVEVDGWGLSCIPCSTQRCLIIHYQLHVHHFSSFLSFSIFFSINTMCWHLGISYY